jgi:GNAT superfamily N-acetyltransferase
LTSPDGIELVVVGWTDPRVEPLRMGLAAVYAERYADAGVDVMADARPEQFDPPGGALVLALLDGDTVAGGGLRRIDAGVGELKRIWTSAAHRRQGLGALVLGELERLAVELGYRTLRLETGPRQPEAAAMYERAGYRRIAVYGAYDQALAFERDLPGVPQTG